MYIYDLLENKNQLQKNNKIINESTLGFNFDSQYDADIAKAFGSLVKYNHGLYKSAKQAAFLKRQYGWDIQIAFHDPNPNGERTSQFRWDARELKDFFNIDLPAGCKALGCSGYVRWAEGNKGYRPVHWYYIIDDLGVVAKYKLGYKITGPGSMGADRNKTVLEWERSKNIDATQLEKDIQAAADAKVEYDKVNAEIAAKGSHVGTEKERLAGEIVTVEGCWGPKYGAYGSYYINRLRDSAGRALLYFGNKIGDKGSKFKMNYTVKKHDRDSRTGEPITIINRPKQIEPLSEGMVVSSPLVGLTDRIKDLATRITFVKKKLSFAPHDQKAQRDLELLSTKYKELTGRDFTGESIGRLGSLGSSDESINNPSVADLKDEFKDYDYYYSYSDDHRYWKAGEAAKKRIMQHIKGLGLTPDQGKLLWKEVGRTEDYPFSVTENRLRETSIDRGQLQQARDEGYQSAAWDAADGMGDPCPYPEGSSLWVAWNDGYKEYQYEHAFDESSPPPFKDMLAAGFPDVKPGDIIRTRKAPMTGEVIRVEPYKSWNSDAVYFRVEDGRLLRTPLSNVTLVSKGSKIAESNTYKLDLFMKINSKKYKKVAEGIPNKELKLVLLGMSDKYKKSVNCFEWRKSNSITEAITPIQLPKELSKRRSQRHHMHPYYDFVFIGANVYPELEQMGPPWKVIKFHSESKVQIKRGQSIKNLDIIDLVPFDEVEYNMEKEQ